MKSPDLILLHAPHVYDFRKAPQLYGPVSDLVPATPVFEMYPLGFASLVEYLEKAGYLVRIVNLAYRMLRDARFDVEKFIQKLEAPLFGIDLHWMVHAHGAVEIARLVKKCHPLAKIVLGGFTASYYWRELIEYPEIDYVMRGDSAEEPMRALLRTFKSRRLGSVANLVWKDSRGTVRENALSHVPKHLGGVMRDHYGMMLRQVIRYRDLKSIIPFKGWLSHPITAVFTCRGCEQQCIFCGGSKSALKKVVGRQETAFRSPEEIHRDVKNLSRLSRGPIFVLSDIRQGGENQAADFLHRLQREPVGNTVMFELYWPAPARFVTDISLAAPQFGLSISPHSHDSDIRRALGLNYTNAALEETITVGLSSGARRFEVYFMIGLPRQTREAVLADVAYCEQLLRRFDGDPRLIIYQGPLAPFLDPGSLAFEHPERYGYKLHYRTLAEHRQALLQPSWKHILNYETQWLSRDDIMDVTYEATIRLTRAKAKYGQISGALAEAQIARIAQARRLEEKIDVLIQNGRQEETAHLWTEIGQVNDFAAVQHRQLIEVPLGALRLRYLSALWRMITGK
ncbi:MAG: TIGR04190 family B12-binding domain/radical SAM domain protein [Dehalococcoidia bacterium]|nr:TIGR04190 family B12-binding domain/radical SAM domain protein [Dehalococcoidia bacterium]